MDILFLQNAFGWVLDKLAGCCRDLESVLLNFPGHWMESFPFLNRWESGITAGSVSDFSRCQMHPPAGILCVQQDDIIKFFVSVSDVSMDL